MVQTLDTDTKFDNIFTREFGFPKGRAATKVVDFIDDRARAFIRESPFLVMATSSADGTCDASPKGGKPGWVKILDDRSLLIPDVAGNKLFQSYLNMSENPNVALIFFIPGTPETVRVNGRTRVVNRDELDEMQVELEVFDPDENSKILQGVVVEVGEAYGHCPRALNFSRLWKSV